MTGGSTGHLPLNPYDNISLYIRLRTLFSPMTFIISDGHFSLKRTLILSHLSKQVHISAYNCANILIYDFDIAIPPFNIQ